MIFNKKLLFTTLNLVSYKRFTYLLRIKPKPKYYTYYIRRVASIRIQNNLVLSQINKEFCIYQWVRVVLLIS